MVRTQALGLVCKPILAERECRILYYASAYMCTHIKCVCMWKQAHVCIMCMCVCLCVVYVCGLTCLCLCIHAYGCGYVCLCVLRPYQCTGIVGYAAKVFPAKNSNAQAAQLASLVYKKKRPETLLRLLWSSNTRNKAAGSCARWYFKIDGQECSEPQPVEGLLYQSVSSNIYRYNTLVGFCRSTAAGVIDKGNHTITVHVGKCRIRSLTTGTNAYSMWATGSTMQVDEYCQ